MPLPQLEKTWEFRTNEATVGTSSELSYEAIAYQMKQMLTDTVANGFQDGTFVNVGGDNWEIQGITDDVMTAGLVGKTIKIRGSTTAANDGEYTVTAVPTSDSVRYLNVAGVAEAVNGSWNVLGGTLTSPWVIQHSQVASLGAGPVVNDGVDRWGTIAASAVEFDNGSYVVLRNPVTETEWMWSGVVQNGGDNAATIRMCTSPNYFETYTGGTSTVGYPPGNTITDINGTAASHLSFRTKEDWITASNSAHVAKLHLAISDDGKNTRMMFASFGVIAAVWFDETVSDPHPDWVAGGNPTVVSAMRNTGATSNVMTYGTLNDNASVYASEFPAVGSSPIKRANGPVYMTSEGYISSANGQGQIVANELTGEWPMHPIGLVSTNLGSRSRLGYIPDMWWVSTGMAAGMTMPDDVTRQFLVLEDIAIPWDGSIPELT